MIPNYTHAVVVAVRVQDRVHHYYTLVRNAADNAEAEMLALEAHPECHVVTCIPLDSLAPYTNGVADLGWFTVPATRKEVR